MLSLLDNNNDTAIEAIVLPNCIQSCNVYYLFTMWPSPQKS